MNEFTAGIMIFGVCLLILFIVFFRNKIESLVSVIIRGIVGTAAIYGLNQLLLYWGISSLVGINPITVLTSAILGLPGVCLLYGLLLL